MANILFWVVIACVLEFSYQQSVNIQFEAFRSYLEIEKLVSASRNLSDDITSVLEEAQAAYADTIVWNKNSIVTVLTAAVKPYSNIIKDAASLVNKYQNNAAKECVASAQIYIKQQVDAGVKVTLGCTVRTNQKIFQFTTRLASIDARKGATHFEAASICPPYFLIENLEELSNAKICYAQAGSGLRDYINQTSKELYNLRITLTELQQQASACSSNGEEAAARGGQAVVDNMISCGKAAGVLLLPRNLLDVIDASVADLEDLKLDAEERIADAQDAVDNAFAFFTSINARIKSTIKNVLKSTSGNISVYEELIKSTPSTNASSCIDDAKSRYNVILQSATNQTVACVAAAADKLNKSALDEAKARLKTIFTNATVKLVTQCTSDHSLTEDTVRDCLYNAFGNIQADAWTEIINSESAITSIEDLKKTAEDCVEKHKAHASEVGKVILESLNSCLITSGIEDILV